MTRLIDADKFIETAKSKLDMQDSYLPVDIKEFVLDKMPTIDAMPVRHAKWVYEGKLYYSDNNTHNTWSCSACGCREFSLSRYCPNCGARMDEQ